MTDKIPDQVTEFIKANAPAMNQLGFGGVMGYCSGMAFRRVGRLFGVVLGVGFMGAQAAAASGYIDIDWEKVKGDAIKPFDLVRISAAAKKPNVLEFLNSYKSLRMHFIRRIKMER